MSKKYDFGGYATRNNIKCADGRTIRRDAFIENDGKEVPLVWNHQHDGPDNVLGHALLENREDGVYAYCSFNDSSKGRDAKEAVKHGDVKSLSIYANRLKQVGGDVIHGLIREVSLVLAGANPGATIDTVIAHSDTIDEHAIIKFVDIPGMELKHSDEETEKEDQPDVMQHAEEPEKKEEPKKEAEPQEEKKVANEKTVKDVFDEFTEEQKNVVYALIGMAVEEAKGGKEDMQHNVFESDVNEGDFLSHADMEAIFADAKHLGSLKDAAIAHGIEDIEYLFPDAQTMQNAPEFVKREDEWVSKVMAAVHHTPFSRIKSVFADITEDDARAKGFLPDHTHRDAKGNLVDANGNPAYKKEEVFGLMKRTTTPTTIYKKQKLDRDDVVDITDFDVVAWLKTEMRGMLNEEIARAILLGDGRSISSDDKINEQNIRPIWKDEDFYTIKKAIETTGDMTKDAKELIKAAVRARKQYKGSGNPVFYTTEDVLTEMLLLEDTNQHRLYNSVNDLAAAMRVTSIVTVPVMENQTRTDDDGVVHTLAGIIVNLKDYNVGADKGGAVNMFDDFDIDYNTQKYLIETRISGAMIKPYAAIALELVPSAQG